MGSGPCAWSEEPREKHLAWDGLVLRHDDDWWDTHYPPNGWGCKCFVEALSVSNLMRRGKSEPDTAPPIEERTVEVGTRGPNPRTVTVPEGIDPGWDYAPGQSRIDGRGPAPVASPQSVAEHVTEGRRIRDELTSEVRSREGLAPGDPEYPTHLRAMLIQRLARERGAGTVEPRVGTAGYAERDQDAAAAVRLAAARMPASWVQAANRSRVLVRSRDRVPGEALGDYMSAQAFPRKVALTGRRDYTVPPGRAIITTSGYANSLHEYTHHLQATVPGLDRQFRAMHRRRTTRPDGERDPVLQLEGYREGLVGREDRYVDPYFGAEYQAEAGEWPEGPMEVMTSTFQMVFARRGWVGGLERLLADNPELLDFAVGLLFRFDPR